MSAAKKSGAATPPPDGGAPTLDTLPPDPGLVKGLPDASEPNVIETTVVDLINHLSRFPGDTPIAITGAIQVDGEEWVP